MAALTINATDKNRGIRFLEDVTITNQVAASTTVTKAVKVPGWARSASFYLYSDSMAGTGEGLTFAVGVPDFGEAAFLAAPDDGNVATVVQGLVLVTNTAILQQFHVGPGQVAGTGSTSADSIQGCNMELPPWLTYSYTTTDGADDCDYAFRVVCVFRGDKS